MNKLRFALVGCGRISKKHVESLQSIDNAELVAVCDIDYVKRLALGESHHLPYYKDYKIMFKEKFIDVVCILTPSGLHAQHVIDIATNYQKHIVVEKPMALTSRDAKNMVDVCHEAGVKLFVVKQNRFNKAVVKLLEAVKAKRFGKLVMGTVRVRWSRDQKYYQDGWHGTRHMDGGIFWNQASHHIDLLLHIMGRPKRFNMMSAKRLLDLETEDTAVATVEFENGALGVIEATVATRPEDLEGSISILGERGTVEIGGFALNGMKVWKFTDDDSLEEENAILDFSEIPESYYGFGHKRYLQAVADCIQYDLDPKKLGLSNGEEGMQVVDFIERLYQEGDKKYAI